MTGIGFIPGVYSSLTQTYCHVTYIRKVDIKIDQQASLVEMNLLVLVITFTIIKYSCENVTTNQAAALCSRPYELFKS